MIKIGDKVRTTKGDKITKTPGVHIVIKTGKMWGRFPAVVCQKPDGTKKLFLLKNLEKVS